QQHLEAERKALGAFYRVQSENLIIGSAYIKYAFGTETVHISHRWNPLATTFIFVTHGTGCQLGTPYSRSDTAPRFLRKRYSSSIATHPVAVTAIVAANSPPLGISSAKKLRANGTTMTKTRPSTMAATSSARHLSNGRARAPNTHR